MNSPAENIAFDKPERRSTLFSLPTVQRMLPLVRQIVADYQASQRDLARMHPEQEMLERHKRELTWPERSRRYQLQEEIAATERTLGEAQAELEGLGIVVLDAGAGRVGFATVVNNQPAYFSWQPRDENLGHWHFAEETVLRPIPSAWFQEGEVRILGKG